MITPETLIFAACAATGAYMLARLPHLIVNRYALRRYLLGGTELVVDLVLVASLVVLATHAITPPTPMLVNATVYNGTTIVYNVTATITPYNHTEILQHVTPLATVYTPLFMLFAFLLKVMIAAAAEIYYTVRGPTST